MTMRQRRRQRNHSIGFRCDILVKRAMSNPGAMERLYDFVMGRRDTP
jgi:hypothetical protein